MPVVVVAVVMWESPQRFPRAGERVGKQFYRFPMLSTDRHFHRLDPQRTISARWGGTASTGRHTSRSAFFAPFQRAPEAEGLGSGVDDVGSIRDPIQQRFAEPRIRKHGRLERYLQTHRYPTRLSPRCPNCG